MPRVTYDIVFTKSSDEPVTYITIYIHIYIFYLDVSVYIYTYIQRPRDTMRTVHVDINKMSCAVKSIDLTGTRVSLRKTIIESIST